MAVLPSPTEIWNSWSTQIMVLLSLVCELALFLLAGIRRRGDEAHPVLRSILWTAYQMSDYTATSALGHLSIRAVGEHPIVALWAPFFLLHLGGPDNITAYSLEDLKLWRRHLLNAILRVGGAVYIVVTSTSTAADSLRLASILMLAVGGVKYVEKTWALMCSDLDIIRGSVGKQPPAIHGHFHPQDMVVREDGELAEESYLRLAHSLFHICKRAMVDYPVIKEEEDHTQGQHTSKVVSTKGVRLWNLMESELSLMYDMLYTKAAVVHTWFGYSVRLVSPLVILASFRVFRFAPCCEREADKVITYVLYGGALFMETTSLLNALGSSWTFAFLSSTSCGWLRKAALCSKRWDWLRKYVVYLHRLVRLGGGSRYTSRRWTCTIGQYKMLHFCTRSQSALLGRLTKKVGLGFHERWNTGHYSWHDKVPEYVIELISAHMKKVYRGKNSINRMGMLQNRWGEKPLIRNALLPDDMLEDSLQDGILEDLLQDGILEDSLGVEFQECIILWHIATEVFLTKKREGNNDDDQESTKVLEAIELISNYMMFLLVVQPDMLPGLSQSRLYKLTCKHLEDQPTHSAGHINLCAELKNLFCVGDGPSSNSRVTDREKLAKAIYDGTGDFIQNSPLTDVSVLAKKLVTMQEPLSSVNLVRDMWIDILVYASNKCSRKSHADKLSSGCELTTILWLMVEHFYQLDMENIPIPSNST